MAHTVATHWILSSNYLRFDHFGVSLGVVMCFLFLHVYAVQNLFAVLVCFKLSALL